MERRPPSSSRVRIPGGYGNYPGRDPESPPQQQSDGTSGGGGGGGRQKKRAQAPWGGLFKGKEDVALPTAPWTLGAPADGRSDEPPQQHWQQQQQQWQSQSESHAQTPAWAGPAASGGGGGAAPSGGVGRGYGPPPPAGLVFSSPPPPRRRASPLVENAPRLTVIQRDDYGSGGGVEVGSEGGRSATGGARGTQQQQQQQRGPVGSQVSQRSVGTTLLSAAVASPSSSSSSTHGGVSRWGSWGIGRSGGITANADSGALTSNQGAERTALLASASSRTGGGTVSSVGSARSSVFSVEPPGAAAAAAGERPRASGRGPPRSGEGFAAEGRPSPFLVARSTSSSVSSAGGKKRSTWRSPLEQSAVNPFSASFETTGGGGGGGLQRENSNTWWAAETGTQSRRHLAGNGGAGGRGGTVARGGGVLSSAGQPLLRRAGAGGGYGSGWGDGGVGMVGGGDIERKTSSDKPKTAFAKGRKVDDQGHQIFYKHGVRLVEAAEIQLESLGSPATYAVFILPYLLLALALWLDMGKLDVTSRLYPPSGNACDDSGVCSWNVTGAPIHNSFLMVKGDFDFEVVDGLVTPSPSDGVATGGGGGGGGGEGDAVDGQESAGGQRSRRGLAIEDGDGDEEMTEGRRRGLMLPFRNRGVQQDADDDVEQLALGVALEIRGLVGGTEMWESLYSCAAQDNVQILNCHPSEMECDTSTLGRVVLDSIGIIGHHSEYAVKATILAIQGGQPIPGGGGLVARSTTFKVETESRVYSEVRSMARLPLLALTAFLLLYWMTRGFGGAGGERDPAPSAIVPERRYITMLLFGLLLWQNPVMAVEDWLLGPSSFDTGPWRWVRLCKDLCQFIGMQVMWLCWICLMDGQHFVRKRSQRSDSSFDGSVTAADVAYRQVAGEDGDASVDAKGGESAASPCFLKDDYPPHHPKSDSFIDFILPKVLYGFLSLLVGVAVNLLRHPYLARLDQVDWLNGRFELSYAMMSMVSGLLWLGWTMWFAAVAVTSGRVLRGQPFFGTRRQQLSYRVMVMQGMLVAVLFGMSVGVDIFYLVGHLLRQQVVVGASNGFTLESMTSAAAGLSAWTGGIRQPLGKLILVSAVCYNVAYLFLPPTHSVKRLFDRMYINMERDMPPREVVRRYKDSQELSPLFCVETSCFLVEVAWQAYYDPHKVDLSDFVAPGRQDLSYLGLELVAYFNDEKHEIRAILCRGEDRLILAFRGTARMENLMTDLKFHQVPLPQLLPPGREPIEIQLPDGNSRRYSSVFSDNDAQRDSRSYSNNSTSKRSRSRNFDGGVGSGDGPSWSRSDVSRSRSPARSSATAAAPRGARRAGAARFSPARVGRGLPPTNRPAAAAAAAAAATATKTPASPGKVVSDSTPRAVEARSAPEGGGASRGVGKGEEAAGAAAPGGGDGGAACGVTSSLPETGATSSVAEAGDGGGGGGTDGEEQGSEGGVSRDESAAQRDKQSGAVDAAGDETSKPEEAAATGAPAPSRPKNPNDLVRLFISESGGGSNGRAHTDGGGGDSGGRIVDSQSAAASAPADIGGSNNSADSADGGNGTDNDSEDGHIDVDGDADADAQQHVPAAGDGQEEGEGHEGQHWADGCSVGGGGDSDGESKFGGDAYNNDAVGDGDDLEAAGGNFGEGDFHIDPQGDGSFTTTAARCFKAVIHRIPVARQALPRVHGGFWEAYSVLRERVLAALAAEMQDDYRPLYVTGHSLGGALASLAAYDIDKNFTLPDPMTLYTFGSPRVGNGVFARKLDSKVKHHFRLVNDGDLITALPRFFGTYKHAGCKVVVDSERYGNFIVAPTLVEQTFGAKPLASLTPHLLNQYRECLEACMEEADLEDYFSRGIGVDPTLVPEWLKGRRRRRKEDEPTLL